MSITSNNVDAFAENVGLDSSDFDFTYGMGGSGSLVVVGALPALTAEAHYTDLTITSTGVLKPGGYRIYVSGTLTIEAGGSINDDGNNASGTTPGAALAARGFLGAGGSIGGGGVVTTFAGLSGGTSANTSLNNSYQLPRGGAGGAAGASAGGAGGNSTLLAGTPHISTSWPTGRPPTGGYNGGSGGGGGAGFSCGGGGVGLGLASGAVAAGAACSATGAQISALKATIGSVRDQFTPQARASTSRAWASRDSASAGPELPAAGGLRSWAGAAFMACALLNFRFAPTAQCG
jgi:hypothetical protein